MTSLFTPTTQPTSGIIEHELIEPREIDAAMCNRVGAAMTHATDLNRHRTAMLRDAADPSTAAALFISLTAGTAQLITDFGWPTAVSEWMTQHEDLSCWTRRYAIRKLTEPGDDLAIHAVQTRIARLIAGFPAPATEDELTLLHHEPVALVRAAYAVARDLTP